MQAQAVQRPQGSDECRDAQGAEPIRLPVRGSDEELERRALLVPDAAVVRGDHAETVVAGVEVAVERLAAIAGLLPVGVSTFELVAKPVEFGRDEAERGVVDLEIAHERRQAQRRRRIVGPSVRDDSLDMNRRRLIVVWQVAGVDRRHAIATREQHLPVLRDGQVRRVAAQMIRTEGTIRCVQHQRPDGGRRPAAVHCSGPRVQVSAGDPHHRALRVDPRRAIGAHDAGLDFVARQTPLGIQRGNAARFQSAQAALGGDPDGSVGVGTDVIDMALAQSIARRVRLPHATIDDTCNPAQEEAEPHPASNRVDRQAPRRPAPGDVRPRELLHDAIAGDLLQSGIPTRDPKGAVAVLDDRIDESAGLAHGDEAVALEKSEARPRSEPESAKAIQEQGRRRRLRKTVDLDRFDGPE